MLILKKCPFCGGKSSVWFKHVKYGAIAYVECDVCCAKSKAFSYYGTDEYLDTNDQGAQRAIEAWNRREYDDE